MAWKCLFCFSIPGVFPESPRWLLLSERSADLNSFSERRDRERDDESFTGVWEPFCLSASVFSWDLLSAVWKRLCWCLQCDMVVWHCCHYCRVGLGAVSLYLPPPVLPRACTQQEHLEKHVCARLHLVSHLTVLFDVCPHMFGQTLISCTHSNSSRSTSSRYVVV